MRANLIAEQNRNEFASVLAVIDEVPLVSMKVARMVDLVDLVDLVELAYQWATTETRDA